MTIKTYRFHARNLYNAWNYAGAVPPALTRQGLVQALAGSAIRELTASTNGGYDAHIELDRDTHHDAVTEIESALMQLAFYTVQAEVTELATATVEGALLGGSAGSPESGGSPSFRSLSRALAPSRGAASHKGIGPPPRCAGWRDSSGNGPTCARWQPSPRQVSEASMVCKPPCV